MKTSNVIVIQMLTLISTVLSAQTVQNPVAWWKFDETSGIVAQDSVGSADGTLTNGPLWTYGIINGALFLDGFNDYVEAVGYTGITGSTSRTCCAWIKTTDAGGANILSWGTSQPGQRWLISINSEGLLGLAVTGGSITGSTPVNDGIWHHIAVAFQENATPNVSDAVLYVDGKPETISEIRPQTINTATDANVKIGIYHDVYNFYYNGYIDDVRIYDQALDGSRINDIALSCLPDPVFYLPFNESAGFIAPDIAAGHNGTLINMSSADWTAGVEGNALDFDGNDDYVEAVGYQGITGSADRTCSAWIKTYATPGIILSWGTLDPGMRWLIGIDGDGFLTLAVTGGSITGSTPVNDGRWHHIAVVFENDGTPDVTDAVLYIDGVRDSVSDTRPQTIYTADDEYVKIGIFPDGNNSYFDGCIDDVRIYDRALAPKQIDALLNEMLPITLWVDDDYTYDGDNDGHIWGLNAFNKIAQAIEMAGAGYAVHVAPGIYSESITLKNEVALIGANAECCILNGDERQFLQIVYSQGCGPSTLLQGFTVTNGVIYGGMYNSNSNPTITDCIFTNNTSNRDGTYGGGGMFNLHSSPEITRCKFINNIALYGNGGGICNWENSNPVITHCQFIGNSAHTNGGAIYNSIGCNPTITQSLFYGNIADNAGGAVNNNQNSTVIFQNCTFTANEALYGGGICNYYAASTIVNSIFWDNVAFTSGNEIYNYNTMPLIRYCDIDGSGVSSDWWDRSLGTDGGGNIDINPLFVASDDFHLQSQSGHINLDPYGPLWNIDAQNSPCIDAGDPGYNVEDEPVPNGGRINMGAYGGTKQAARSAIIPGDVNQNGFVDLTDLAILAQNWLQGTPPPRQ